MIKDLGPADATKSLREWIDSLANPQQITRASRKIDTPKAKKLFKYSAERIANMESISVAKAKFYK